MIHSAIDIGLCAAETEDAGASGEGGILIRRLPALRAWRTVARLAPKPRLPKDAFAASRTSWHSSPDRAVRCRAAASSIRWYGSWRFRRKPPTERFRISRRRKTPRYRIVWSGTAGLRRPESACGSAAVLAKFFDETIVFSREDIMKKTQTDVPIVRKGDGFLA